jgi:hypothetical protein
MKRLDSPMTTVMVPEPIFVDIDFEAVLLFCLLGLTLSLVMLNANPSGLTVPAVY